MNKTFEASSKVFYKEVRNSLREVDAACGADKMRPRRGHDAAIAVLCSATAAVMLALPAFVAYPSSSRDRARSGAFCVMESLVPLGSVCLVAASSSRERARFGLLYAVGLCCSVAGALSVGIARASLAVIVRSAAEATFLASVATFVGIRCALAWLARESRPPEPLPDVADRPALTTAVVERFRWFIAWAQASALFVVVLDVQTGGGYRAFSAVMCSVAGTAVLPVVFALLPPRPSRLARGAFLAAAAASCLAQFAAGIVLPIVQTIAAWARHAGDAGVICAFRDTDDCAAFALRTYFAIFASAACSGYAFYCAFVATVPIDKKAMTE